MNTHPDPIDTEAIADVRALVSRLDPAPELPLSTGDLLRGADVLERVLSAPISVTPRPLARAGQKLGRALRAPSARSRNVRLVAAVSAAAGLLVAAAATVALQAGRTPASATPVLPAPLSFGHGTHQAAVGLLQKAALLEGTAAPWPSTATVYAMTQDYALGADVASSQRSTKYVVTTIRRVWVAPGCTGAEDSQVQETNAVTGADIGGPGAATSDPHWQDTNCALPTNPQALMSALVGPDASGDDDAQRSYALADGVMTQLGLGTARPAQVAALYRVLASLPGVFDAGTVRDDDGRLGQAIGVPSGTVNSSPLATSVASPTPAGCVGAAAGAAWDYFVLDAATGQPLEVEEVDAVPPCALGLPSRPTVGQYNVILTAGSVGGIGKVAR